jgi:hypothetical protein
VPDHHSGRVNPIEKRVEQFEEAYDKVGRYLILTNGGGAIAASAFLGSTIASGHVSGLAAIPLLCFYAGLVTAGLVVFGKLVSSWKMTTEDPAARELIINGNFVLRHVDRWTEPPLRVITISYVCLIVVGISAAAVYLITAEPYLYLAYKLTAQIFS